MPRTNLSMSISADGYVAGPNQSKDHPLGIGGELLHGWHLGPAKDHAVNQLVIAGGASCARQAIVAGLVDEIDLQVNPVMRLLRRCAHPCHHGHHGRRRLDL